MLCICKTQQRNIAKTEISPFPKKGDIGISNKNSVITRNYITDKGYNALLLNLIQPVVEKILRKISLVFERMDRQLHGF